MTPTQYEQKQNFIIKGVMLLGAMSSVRANEDDIFLRHLDLMEHEIVTLRSTLAKRRFIDTENINDEDL